MSLRDDAGYLKQVQLQQGGEGGEIELRSMHVEGS